MAEVLYRVDITKTHRDIFYESVKHFDAHDVAKAFKKHWETAGTRFPIPGDILSMLPKEHYAMIDDQKYRIEHDGKKTRIFN
jgi:hypothetical protein